MNPLLDDVLSQPKALRQTLKAYRTSFPEVLREVAQGSREGTFQRVVLTGMGSSYFASVAAGNYLAVHGFPATVVETGELLYYGVSTLQPGTLVILTSQSGETIEAVKLLDALQAADGVRVLGVTNNPESTLARRASLTLHLQTAKDYSVAIKTYSSTLMALTLLAGAIVGENSETVFAYLEQAAENMAGQFARFERAARDIAAFLKQAPYTELIGRGASLASALEGALLLREGAKTFGAAITGGQVRHGAVEVIAPGYVAVIFAPRGRSGDLQRSLAQEIVRYGGRVVLLSPPDEGWTGGPEGAVLHVPVEAPDEYRAVFAEIVPLQLAAYHLALERGLTPGEFVNTVPVIVTE